MSTTAEDLERFDYVTREHGPRAAARFGYMLAKEDGLPIAWGLEQLAQMYGPDDDSKRLDWLGVFGRLYQRDFAVRLAAEVTGDRELAERWWSELRACSFEQRRVLAMAMNDLEFFSKRLPKALRKMLESLNSADYSTLWILLYGLLPSPARAGDTSGPAREADAAEDVARALGLDGIDFTSDAFKSRAHDGGEQ